MLSNRFPVGGLVVLAALAWGAAPAMATACPGADPCPWDSSAQIGLLGENEGVLRQPVDAATTPSGDVLVQDSAVGAIFRYTATGTFVDQVAGYARRSLEGVATDGTSVFFFGDDGGIAKRPLAGGSVTSIAPGLLPFAGLAVTGSGATQHLFAGLRSSVVEIDATTGATVRTYGSEGTGDGQLQQVSDVAVDAANGRLYVADGAAGRIEEYSTADGDFIQHIGPGDTIGGNPAPYSPTDIAVDGSGALYAVGYADLRKYTVGASTATIAASAYLYNQNTALTVNAAGTSVYAGGVPFRRYTPSLQTFAAQEHWGFPPPGRLYEPWGAAFGNDGRLYVAEETANRIAAFTYEGGTLADSFPHGQVDGAAGNGPGEFNTPSDVAVMPPGTAAGDVIVVADTGNSRVQVIDDAGQVLTQLDHGPTAMDALAPEAVAASPDSQLVLVADRWKDVVYAFELQHGGSWELAYQRTIGTKAADPNHPQDGELFGIEGVAFGPGGDILVADRGNHISRFSPTGTFKGYIGAFGGGGDGTLQLPNGVDYDPAVGIVVTDVTSHVTIYNADGTYQRSFGASEYDAPAPGRFRFTNDVDISPAGDVVVTDTFAHLLKRFDLVPVTPPPSADLEMQSIVASPDPVVTGAFATYTATLRNNGPSAATGVSVTFTKSGGVTLGSDHSAGCTAAATTVTCPVSGTLASGASVAVHAALKAPAAPGSMAVSVAATSSVSDPSSGNNSRATTTQVKAPDPTGTAVLTVEPGDLDFGDVAVDTTSAPANVLLRNTGTADLVLPADALELSARFAFAENAGQCVNTTLAPGASCNVGVAFVAKAAGRVDGTLHVKASNAPDRDVALRGTGVATATPAPPQPLAGSSGPVLLPPEDQPVTTVKIPRFIAGCGSKTPKDKACPNKAGDYSFKRLADVREFVETLRAKGVPFRYVESAKPLGAVATSGETNALKALGAKADGAILDQTPAPSSIVQTSFANPVLIKVGFYDAASEAKLTLAAKQAAAAVEDKLRAKRKQVPACDLELLPRHGGTLAKPSLDILFLSATPQQAKAIVKRYPNCAPPTFDFDDAIVQIPGVSKVLGFEDVETSSGKTMHSIKLRVRMPRKPSLALVVRENPTTKDLGIGDDAKLTVSDTQRNSIVVQVVQVGNGTLLAGATVSFLTRDGKWGEFTTDSHGEVALFPLVTRDWGTSPDPFALEAYVRGKDGAEMWGFREIGAVDRGGKPFTTMSRRAMTRKDGTYRSSAEDLAEAQALKLAPANLGLGFASRPTTTAQVKQVPVTVYGTSTKVDGTANGIELTDADVQVAAGTELVAIAGGEPARRASGRGFRAGLCCDALQLVGAILNPFSLPVVAGMAAVQGLLDQQDKAKIEQTNQGLAQAKVAVPPPPQDPVASLLGWFNNVIASGGGNVIASGGGNVIASGGGNVIASGGGNVIASGGGNVIPVSGSPVIASGGGNVIASGGGNVIASGGGNVIASGGGN